MRHLVLAAWLVATSASAQNIYEWVDASGEHHFTDDPTKVPKNVKPKVTAQEAPPTPTPAPPRTPGTSSPRPTSQLADCEGPRARIVELEKAIVRAKELVEQRRKDHAAKCHSRLLTHGQPGYAVCMAEEIKDADTSSQEKALEEARDQLRRAQISGCR
ncbi:MAG: DUF4124 domain-containing protein [Myxococcota bacterium]